MRNSFSRLLVLLVFAALLSLTCIPALAASYNYDVTNGGVLTVNTGDTIYITNSHSTSGMVLTAYGWSSSNHDIVTIENGVSSRNATLKAVGPGTVTIKGELTGAFQIENYGTRYNSATGKYEQYKYYTTQSYTYPYGCNITVTDTLAPEITSQPKSTHSPVGSTVSLSISATDHSDMSYQWYYYLPGQSHQKGGTAATFSFEMADNMHGLKVYCIVTDQYGNSVTSGTATIHRLGISKQPTNAYRKDGETISTSVTAYGEGLSYVWYYRDAGTTAWKKSNITTAKCSFKMTTAKDEREIYCLITDAHGNSIKSKVVTVNIEEYAAITTQPKQTFGKVGETLKLSVKATGDGLKYLWYYKDVGDSAYKASKITTATCNIPLTAAKSGRKVYCVVTDQYGNSVQSKTVTIAVLQITKQPADSYGITANTSVTAKGDGLKYVWYYRNAGTTAWKKSNITTAKCTFAMTPAKDEREIYCKITDKYGNSINSNVVKVHYPDGVYIATQPKQAYGAAGSTITLTIKAVGDGVKYLWYYKDVGDSAFKASKITTATCSIPMTAAKSGRQIYCVVSDCYGNTVKSKTVTIAQLAITRQPTDASGLKATTSVTAVGDGLKYVWYYKDVGKSSFTASAITTATCTVSMTAAKVGRQIYCKITDKYGNSIKSNTVTLSLVRITQQPRDAFGASVSIPVKAEGDNLSYQWYYKDSTMSDFAKDSNVTDTYTCSMTASNHLRQIYCVVTDEHGNSVKSDTATLYRFAITTQPKTSAISSTSGYKHTYSVTAVGEGLTYQWYWAQPDQPDVFGEIPVTASSFDYTITDENSGSAFYCIVKDKYGHSIKSNVVYAYLFKMTRTSTIYLSTLPSDAEQILITAEASCPMREFKWYKYNQWTDSYDRVFNSQLTGYTQTETGCSFYINVADLSAGDAYECYYYNKWNCYSAFIIYIKK